MTWQLQQAQAQFSELLDATIKDDPQIVSRDGEELAVLVPIDEWKRMRSGQFASLESTQDQQRPTLKDVLLCNSPRIDDMMIPERGHLLHRDPPEFWRCFSSTQMYFRKRARINPMAPCLPGW